jgi:hypothetical protein
MNGGKDNELLILTLEGSELWGSRSVYFTSGEGEEVR